MDTKKRETFIWKGESPWPKTAARYDVGLPGVARCGDQIVQLHGRPRKPLHRFGVLYAENRISSSSSQNQQYISVSISEMLET